MNPSVAEVMLREYMGDENDIDTLLTVLHTDKKLGFFNMSRLVGFIFDFKDEKYILDAIKQHIDCINNDFMLHLDPSGDEIYYQKSDNTISFTEWLITFLKL